MTTLLRRDRLIYGRTLVFILASSSIACLLADFYGLCPMRLFTPFVFCPALAALATCAAVDKLRGNGDVYRLVWIGASAGLLAALSYDLFRLPFVLAQPFGIDSVIPSMNLFKTFPRFGAMILGQPLEQQTYSLAAHVLGWTYHFSNGATFGIMYLALAGITNRRHWVWAVLFALALELAMLITPYPAVFNIPVTPQFVLVTVLAHAVFGLILGGCIAPLQSLAAVEARRLLNPNCS